MNLKKKKIIWSNIPRLLQMVNLTYCKKERKVARKHCGRQILIHSESHSSIKGMDCCLKLLKKKYCVRASLLFKIIIFPHSAAFELHA